jgi:hypothetical protein
VNVPRVAEQESPPAPELLGHPMVHAVGREPVDPLDLELQAPGHPLADVVPGQRLALRLGFAFDGADQAGGVLPLHREHRQQIGLVEGDMELVVGDRPVNLGVGDVVDPFVGVAREPDLQRLADLRMTTVAARQIDGPAVGRRPVAFDLRDHVIAALLEAGEARAALHLHPLAPKVLDEQPFVLILRKDQHEGKRAQPPAQVGKDDPRRMLAARPQVDRREFQAQPDDLVGEPELAIELERPRVEHQGPRGGARLGRLIDDPDADPEALQPQRQDQAGGSGPDDQDLRLGARVGWSPPLGRTGRRHAKPIVIIAAAMPSAPGGRVRARRGGRPPGRRWWRSAR